MPTDRSFTPKYADDVIIQAGTKAHTLATANQTVLDPRLPQNTISDLAADLLSLGAVVPGVKQAQAEVKAATSSQLVELSAGNKLIRAIRGAVRRSGAPRSVCKAYGIGVRVNPEVAKDVLAVLGMIRDRAAASPKEPDTLGVLAADLTAVDDRIAAIKAAFTTRRQKRAKAPTTTQARNRTLNRILAVVRRIAAAGELEFVNDPEKVSLFRGLVPPPRKKKAATKGNGKTPAPPPPPAPPSAPADPTDASPDPQPAPPAPDPAHPAIDPQPTPPAPTPA